MHNPPILFLKLFRWFCHPDLQKPIEGDLMELYDERVTEIGKKKADRKFVKDVLLLFRRDIIKPTGGTYRLNTYGMFKNYFKVTFRNLFRQKIYSAINIGGLALGITTFLMIFIYVQYERSFDRFYSNADEIYNIYQKQPGNMSLGTDYYAVTPAALPYVLEEEYPEVKHATGMTIYSTLLTSEDQSYFERVAFGTEHFFNVFEHTFIAGNPESALKTPESAVLTQSFAKKLFPNEDPMGKELSFWAGKAYVTGIIQDPPKNSSLRFSSVLSLTSNPYFQEEINREKWNGNAYHTFLTLHGDSKPEQFQAKLKDILKKYWSDPETRDTYLVQSLSGFHLRNFVNEEIGLKGNPKQLRIFSIIAILILTLAAINYMNLAIARSINRAKEVGLRKAIGAHKKQLIIQFLSESLFLSFLAFFLALALIQVALPVFSSLVERQLDMRLIYDLNLIPNLAIMVFLLGIISGSYPALFMSSLQPVAVLKGKIGRMKSGNKLQKFLIVSQYAISISMLICSIIGYQQMQYISEKDLGIEKDQIVSVTVRGSKMRKNIDLIKSQLLSHSNVEAITSISSYPTDVQSSTSLLEDESGGNIYRLYTDNQFLNVFDVELLAGDFLNEKPAISNETEFLINESAAIALGWTAQTAVGKEYINDDDRRKIIGVVADFHMYSMHLPISPLLIGKRDQLRYFSVKLGAGNVSETLIHMEEVTEQHSDYPFDYQFMDDHFNQIYEEDQREGQLLGFFTILAMLIAALGLFGLAAFEAVQHQKEVGIRKVLGASTQNVVWLFGKKFMTLVSLAFLLAIPASWLLIESWLANFAYRIIPSWWMFMLGGAFAILIAFLTISSQSIKAALVNPVESLKNE